MTHPDLIAALHDEDAKFTAELQTGTGLDFYRRISEQHWLRLEALFRRFETPQPSLTPNQLFGQDELPPKPDTL